MSGLDLMFAQVRCATSRKQVAAVDLRRQEEVSSACFIQCSLNVGRNNQRSRAFFPKSIECGAFLHPLAMILRKTKLS